MRGAAAAAASPFSTAGNNSNRKSCLFYTLFTVITNDYSMIPGLGPAAFMFEVLLGSLTSAAASRKSSVSTNMVSLIFLSLPPWTFIAALWIARMADHCAYLLFSFLLRFTLLRLCNSVLPIRP